MVDITHKANTLRKAIAVATVQASAVETIRAVKEKRVPKGDVFEFARAAGLLAVKKTSDVIPDCHPLPVEYTNITYETDELNIYIRTEVHTIYKTGVEVEAMHGAMIAALTLYDMLKPIDKGLEIRSVRLESKTGGKSERTSFSPENIKAAVVVCSDRVSAGLQEDTSGKLLAQLLEAQGIAPKEYSVVADDVDAIQQKAIAYQSQGFDLVIFTGGTGLSKRDVTTYAIQPLLDQEIPGVMETARAYGQQRTPFAMLSCGVAGFIGDTLMLTFPGSPKAVKEMMDALFPAILHVFNIRHGQGH